MKRFQAVLLAGAALALALAIPAAGRSDGAAKAKPQTVDIQLLTVSDWHGQIPPVDVFGVGRVGGAAALGTYFAQERAANPNTLTFMAGDSIGATPPISSFFEDEPAIRVMNMLGVTADTLGNHNFDRGIDHLQSMIDVAEFDFVSSNLRNVEDNLTGVEQMRIYNVGGIKVAVVGATNEEAPEVVTPGAFGTIEITDAVAAVDRKAAVARRAGAQVVVVLTHKGIRGRNADGSAFGELIDFAEAIDGDLVDVVVGDHTDFQYSGLHNEGRVLAVENRSKGLTYARIGLTVDRDAGIQSKSVEFVTPFSDAVAPDAAIQAYIDELTEALKPILGTVIGSSTIEVLRSDACGRGDGRLCESRVGNVVTDALRTAYGVDFAITNSGGLRAALTCPAAGASAFCPASSPDPFPITRGGVLGVLPFGNVSATAMVSGAEVDSFLENGVSRDGAQGRFPQVSGLCFTYDVGLPAGNRVTSIVRQAADGSCTTEVVMPGAMYTLATNDFMAAGGDGYPVIISRVTTRNIMDQDLADYVAANSPISPSIQGRITCTGATCPAITAP